MDPLSNVLALLKPRNYLSAGLDAGGGWSIQFPDQQAGIKSGALVSGECWLSVDGMAEPVHLNTGDCFLLPTGRSFRLASDMALAPIDATAIFTGIPKGGFARVNGGGACSILSNRFALTGQYADHLLQMLPPIVHIRGTPDQSALGWSIDRMMQELCDPQPGGFLIVDHLAHMMLVEALRLHLTDASAARAGWLFALADKQISQALTAMHEDPAHRWTLQNLAERAGMSRSTFAQKFKQAVGTSPMDYLINWRMALASDRLENSSDPIAVIASSLGYKSDAAFSTAFRRVMGCAPRQYSRGMRLVPHSGIKMPP